MFSSARSNHIDPRSVMSEWANSPAILFFVPLVLAQFEYHWVEPITAPAIAV
jgi:hypothetical protein